jgi:hypothetical protein
MTMAVGGIGRSKGQTGYISEKDQVESRLMLLGSVMDSEVIRGNST